MKELLENILKAGDQMKKSPVVKEKDQATELATAIRNKLRGVRSLVAGIILLWLVVLIATTDGVVLAVSYVGAFGQIFAYANLYFGYTFIDLPIRKNWNDMRTALYFTTLTYAMPFITGVLTLILK